MPTSVSRMPEHPKARVLREFYEAFESEDPETTVREFLDPHITWHVAGKNPLAGTFQGPNEVWNAMTRYGEHSHGTLRLDTRSILADDQHAVAIHLATAQVPAPALWRFVTPSDDLRPLEPVGCQPLSAVSFFTRL